MYIRYRYLYIYTPYRVILEMNYISCTNFHYYQKFFVIVERGAAYRLQPPGLADGK